MIRARSLIYSKVYPLGRTLNSENNPALGGFGIQSDPKIPPI
ncbi:MAG: hypothetical protein RLZZ74_2292, partial [Cyanobacteriota bacterium]